MHSIRLSSQEQKCNAENHTQPLYTKEHSKHSSYTVKGLHRCSVCVFTTICNGVFFAEVTAALNKQDLS